MSSRVSIPRSAVSLVSPSPWSWIQCTEAPRGHRRSYISHGGSEHEVCDHHTRRGADVDQNNLFCNVARGRGRHYPCPWLLTRWRRPRVQRDLRAYDEESSQPAHAIVSNEVVKSDVAARRVSPIATLLEASNLSISGGSFGDEVRSLLPPPPLPTATTDH